ncbi:Endoplasmic reticulum metallopeptidase 1 [Chytridiales sp. JEL 0842]|nr:Endoplasmic reticulum metallopeptidase 1 [Chytridiales sp. JEL 0842]
MSSSSKPQVLAIVVGLVGAVLAIVAFNHYNMPTVLQPIDYSHHGLDNLTFSAEAASRFVEEIMKTGPRPYSSQANLNTADLIYGWMKGWEEEYPGRVVVETDRNSVQSYENGGWPSRGKLRRKGQSLISLNVGNIAAKVIGKCEANGGSPKSCPALLVSTHYDSTISSPGATDDVLATAVVLETVKSLVSVNNRLAHSVIFLINNAEEAGLNGAVQFLEHPWFKQVKSFINLEGSGSGGRALLFRASNGQLIKKYGSVPSPHASVLGNDVFKLGLVRSDTDFSVYVTRVPGLDIAFYINRYVYHTKRDAWYSGNLKPSLQHMGSNTLAYVISLTSSEDLMTSDLEINRTPGVFWDERYNKLYFLGFAEYITYATTLFFAATGLVVYGGWKHNKQVSKLPFMPRFNLGYVCAQVASVLGAFLMPVLVTLLVDTLNPLTFYGNNFLWRVVLVTSGLFGALLPQFVWVYPQNQKLKRQVASRGTEAEPLLASARSAAVVANPAAENVRRVGFWRLALVGSMVSWILVLPLSILAAQVEAGSLFYFSLWASSGVLALFVDDFVLENLLGAYWEPDRKKSDDEPVPSDDSASSSSSVSTSRSPTSRTLSQPNDAAAIAPMMQRLSTKSKHRWILAFMIALSLPLLTSLTGLLSLLMAMEPTVQDGTPAVAVSALLSILSAPMYLAVLPYIYYADSVQLLTTGAGLALMGETVFAVVGAFPFNQRHPLKAYFSQEYDLTDPEKPVHRYYTSFNGKHFVGKSKDAVGTDDPLRWFPVHDWERCRPIFSSFYECNVANITTATGLVLPPPDFKNAKTSPLHVEYTSQEIPIGPESGKSLVSISVRSDISRLCYMEGPRSSTDKGAGIYTAWIEDPNMINKPKVDFSLPLLGSAAQEGCCENVVAYQLKMNTTATFHVLVDRKKLRKESGKSVLEVMVGCNVDDLGYVPAWGAFEAEMPPWALLIGAGTGALRMSITGAAMATHDEEEAVGCGGNEQLDIITTDEKERVGAEKIQLTAAAETVLKPPSLATFRPPKRILKRKRKRINEFAEAGEASQPQVEDREGSISDSDPPDLSWMDEEDTAFFPTMKSKRKGTNPQRKSAPIARAHPDSKDEDAEFEVAKSKRPSKKSTTRHLKSASKSHPPNTTGAGRLAKNQAVGITSRKSLFLDADHVVESGLVEWLAPHLKRILTLWVKAFCEKEGKTWKGDETLAEVVYQCLSRQRYPLKFVEGTEARDSGIPVDNLLRRLAYMTLAKTLPFVSTYFTFYADNDANTPADETIGANAEPGWKPLYRPLKTFVLDVFPFASKGTGEPIISLMCNEVDYASLEDEEDQEAWRICCQLQCCNVAFVTTLGLQMAFSEDNTKEQRIQAVIHAVRSNRLIRDREKLRNVKHMHVAQRLIIDRIVSINWFKNPHLPKSVRDKIANPGAVLREKLSSKSSAPLTDDEVKTALEDLNKSHEEIMGISQKSYSSFNWKPRSKGDTSGKVEKGFGGKDEEDYDDDTDEAMIDELEDDIEDDEFEYFEGVEFGLVGKRMGGRRDSGIGGRSKSKAKKRRLSVKDVIPTQVSNNHDDSAQASPVAPMVVGGDEGDDEKLPNWIKRMIQRSKKKIGTEEKIATPEDIVAKWNRQNKKEAARKEKRRSVVKADGSSQDPSAVEKASSIMMQVVFLARKPKEKDALVLLEAHAPAGGVEGGRKSPPADPLDSLGDPHKNSASASDPDESDKVAHNGFTANDPSYRYRSSQGKQASRAIVQIYDVPLTLSSPIQTQVTESKAYSPAYHVVSSLKASIRRIALNSKAPPQTTAKLRAALRIDGKLNLVSLSKNAEPHPAMAFLYYKVNEMQDEHVSYHVKTVGIKGVDGARDMERYLGNSTCTEDSDDQSCDCFGNLTRSDPTFWQCSNSPEQLNIRTLDLPGNMWISKFSYSRTGNFVYASSLRQLDSHVFRIITKKQVESLSDSDNKDTMKSIRGPYLDRSKYGTSLVLLELYAPGSSRSLLDIRYKTIDDDTFEFFIRLIYRESDDHSWVETVLWESLESLKTISDDEPPPADEYHFITNPVVAVNRNSTSAAFVYRSRIFNLDFVGTDIKNTSPHGYLMSNSYVRSMDARDLRVKGAAMSDDGRVLVLSTDTNNVLKFTRKLYLDPEDPIDDLSNRHASSRPSIFEIPNEINFFFDGSLETTPMRNVEQEIEQREKQKEEEGKENGKRHIRNRKANWHIKMQWNPEISDQPSLARSSIVSLTLLPPPPPPKNSGEEGKQQLLALLYDDGNLVVLDLDEEYKGSFYLSFIAGRWPMILAMSMATLFFVSNEMRQAP